MQNQYETGRMTIPPLPHCQFFEIHGSKLIFVERGNQFTGNSIQFTLDFVLLFSIFRNFLRKSVLDKLDTDTVRNFGRNVVFHQLLVLVPKHHMQMWVAAPVVMSSHPRQILRADSIFLCKRHNMPPIYPSHTVCPFSFNSAVVSGEKEK